jgi:DNA-binding MarR family transcriptional regulator
MRVASAGEQAAALWGRAPVTGAPVIPKRPQIVVLSDAGAVPPMLATAAAMIEADVAAYAIAGIDWERLPTGADALWLACPVTDADALVEQAIAHGDTWQQPVIVEVGAAMLDHVWDACGDRGDVAIVSAPDAGECVTALTTALATTRPTLHSPTDTVRDRQIGALQDEVQRIARLLSRLANDDGGDDGGAVGRGREPASPFIESGYGMGGYGADGVRAPSRGFGAASVEPPVTARAVRALIRRRRLRDEFFAADLFADPAWDMLLDLYAATLERHRVSVSSLCIAAAVPATTALRWIKTLTDAGMFSRDADQLDGRRIFVSLTEQAREAMHRYFARLAEE